MSGESKPWERRKPMAKVEGFVRSRLRPALHESESTRLSCIYAHYRKWAFFQDQTAYSLKNFEDMLAKATRRTYEEFRGERMYPVWIRSPETPKKDDDLSLERKAAQAPVVKGQVEVLRELCFREMSIPCGEVLDWLEPNENERERIGLLRSGSPENVRQHIVVMFHGIRRMIPADAIRRRL